MHSTPTGRFGVSSYPVSFASSQDFEDSGHSPAKPNSHKEVPILLQVAYFYWGKKISKQTAKVFGILTFADRLGLSLNSQKN